MAKLKVMTVNLDPEIADGAASKVSKELERSFSWLVRSLLELYKAGKIKLK